MQTEKPDSLSKLLQKKEKIEEQIASTKARLKKKERLEDTRKKILVGAFFMEVKYKGKEDELAKLLDGFLVREKDRALFGLPPKGEAS